MRSVQLAKSCPTRALKRPDLVPSLANLLPAGRYQANDLNGRSCHFDVFVTFERRSGRSTPCGFQVVAGRSEFSFDDGADEFARVTLAGAPTFDQHENVLISAVRRSIGGKKRGCSLWLAYDLSMIAVDDEVFYLK